MRNVCTQANSILTTFILQVIDQLGSPWRQLCLHVSALQSDLPLLCSSGKQPLFRTGSFPASLLQHGVFQLKGAPWVLSLLCQARSLTLSQERNSAK